MRTSILRLLSIVLLASCSEKKSTKNFVLTGNIKGLKKGTLYIQRIEDTLLFPIDTIKINGDSHFTSEFDLQSPEMLYLFLDRGVTNSVDNNISFFAEKGVMNIETSLDFFTADAKITGSKNQELYDEYRKVVSRYVDQDLTLIQKKFNAYKVQNADEVNKIEEEQKGILKRKYLYTTNFAVNTTSAWEDALAVFCGGGCQMLRLSFILNVRNLTTTYYLNSQIIGGSGMGNGTASKITLTRIA
jgi:hypothetical protein